MRSKKIRQYLLVSIIYIAIVKIPLAERLTNVATTAASFLEVGVGSRAIGMGGAYVGIANDVSAIYWNPSGLGLVNQQELIFERIDWLTGIQFNYIAAMIPIGRYGTIGGFVNSMSMPRMKVRTVVYPEGTGEEFDAASLCFGLSYGKMLTDRFSIGFNLKYISERIWHEKAVSFAFDVGTWYQTHLEGLRIGAAITNYGPNMQLDGSDLIIYHDAAPLKMGNNEKIMGKLMTDDWPLPLNMQLGIAYDVFKSKYSQLTTSIDAFHPVNNTEGINIGGELSILNMIFLRGGYKALGQLDSEEGLTLGAGLKYKLFGQSHIKLDYAYADFGRLQEANRFTLRLDF